ncbi:MAG: S8 family serine peptidase, partial [Elusimicrobia bacterium]|nr:S8 family serine peptidase [Elusimicrobiota bacterium]
NGHGTHVAGIIAAVKDNGYGIAGVNPKVKILPIRAIGTFGSARMVGLTSTIVPAVEYAITHGARIINASFGQSRYDSLLQQAIRKAQESGILFVTAAGNNGTDNGYLPNYPANYDLSNIVTVAATDQNDRLAAFSNYASTLVHVAAPGTNIYSSHPTFLIRNRTLWTEDFDGGTIGSLPSDWRTAGTGGGWAIRDGATVSSPYSLEDSPLSNYRDNTHAVVYYDSLFRSQDSRHRYLKFKIRYDLEQNYDYFDVVYSTDKIVWQSALSITGNSSGQFVEKIATLTAVAESYKDFYLGFRLESDSSVTGDGVYVDDVQFTQESLSNYADYAFESGTSMSAAYVSGIASLILSYNSNLSISEIKDILFRGAERKFGLYGKVATGGRVNLYSSLKLVSPAVSSNVGRSDVQVRAGENGYVGEGAARMASIVFRPGSNGVVDLKLYSMTGDLIWNASKVVTEDVQETIQWAGKNGSGHAVSSGIYLLHVTGAGLDVKKKLAVIK